MMIKNIFLALSVLTSLTVSAQSGAIAHSAEADHIRIRVAGLERPMKLMQITDSHVSCDNQSDKQFDHYSTRMRNAFDAVKHHQSIDTVHPSLCFAEMLDKAKAEKVDMLLLTGDIINYPAKSSVDFIISQLGRTGIPFIYTAGNHDWHYEGMEGTSEEIRNEWREKTLKPLYQGTDPSHSSTIVNGINLVTIDNSTYQVSEEQLAFFKKQKKADMPIVLLMHIPLYVEGGSYGCGDPSWGYNTDRNHEIERRVRWPRTGNLKSTVAFVEEVKDTEGIIVLTGHTHKHRVDIDGKMVQYVSDGSYNGRTTVIELIPAE